MNKLSINRIRLARWAAAALMICGVSLLISAAFAQSRSRPSIPPNQWPKEEIREKVKLGFTNALRRSAVDSNYRKRLLSFDVSDVRSAVQEELNKISGLEKEPIPPTILILFYEPEPEPD